MKKWIFALLIGLLSACSSNYHGVAPVQDVNTKQIGNVWYYTVQRGDTLYSAAWRNDMDFEELARLNGIPEPYVIHAGEKLRLNGPVVIQPKTQKRIGKKILPVKEPNIKVSKWNFPVHGKIIHAFSSNTKGIDISTHLNTVVKSSAAGKVVYAGFGIPGYRGLIIIKHNADYLTVYGYNSKILVQNNQWVKSGQPIALSGTNLARVPMEHFEVRRNGKAVDPIRYLI